MWNIWELEIQSPETMRSVEWLIVQKWMDETAEVTTRADQLSELSDEDNDGKTNNFK